MHTAVLQKKMRIEGECLLSPIFLSYNEFGSSMSSVLRKGSFSLTPIESSDSKLTQLTVDSSDANAGQIKIIQRDDINRRIQCEFVIPDQPRARPVDIALAWLAMEYFFEHLKMTKVHVEILANDQASLEFHRKLGFCEEGRLSRHRMVNDKYSDLVLMAHFSETWNKRKKFLEDLFTGSGGEK